MSRSGLPRILSAWQGQHWRTPFLREDTQLDLTYLQLPTLSLLPERVIEDLDARFGASFRHLEEHARLAIATAAIEGRVTNPRLRTLANLHPHDATIIFQSLVQEGFLVPQSAGRWTFYVLPALTGFPQVPAGGETSGASREQVGSKSGASREQVEVSITEARRRVLECAVEPMSLSELMKAAGWRSRVKFTDRILRPLLDESLLSMTIPDHPRSRLQKYVALPPKVL